MTLKTFHFAGVASMNITQGVPRIKEIINADVNINTPIMRASLVTTDTEIGARIVKGRIEKTLLGDIASIQEVFTPKGCYLKVKVDFDTIAALNLELSIELIRMRVLKWKGIKLKEEHIRVEGTAIKIDPPETSR